jgi:hypothetical protein
MIPLSASLPRPCPKPSPASSDPLDPGTSGAMTSPLLRLFAVFWWLLVIASAGFALYGTEGVWENYHSSQDGPFWYVVGGAIVLLLSLLPFIALTVTRWIITARWRFGPRW